MPSKNGLTVELQHPDGTRIVEHATDDNVAQHVHVERLIAARTGSRFQICVAVENDFRWYTAECLCVEVVCGHDQYAAIALSDTLQTGEILSKNQKTKVTLTQTSVSLPGQWPSALQMPKPTSDTQPSRFPNARRFSPNGMSAKRGSIAVFVRRGVTKEGDNGQHFQPIARPAQDACAFYFRNTIAGDMDDSQAMQEQQPSKDSGRGFESAQSTSSRSARASNRARKRGLSETADDSTDQTGQAKDNPRAVGSGLSNYQPPSCVDEKNEEPYLLDTSHDAAQESAEEVIDANAAESAPPTELQGEVDERVPDEDRVRKRARLDLQMEDLAIEEAELELRRKKQALKKQMAELAEETH